jgi:pyruvate dehydrogenase E2 component (dihydrolipoamide acetyltransferase)
MLGLPTGFTPLAAMYKVPAIVLLGEITDKPVAVNGHVEVRPILPVTATIDHRYADGAELAQALKAFREYLENPFGFEPALEQSAPAVSVPQLRSVR